MNQARSKVVNGMIQVAGVKDMQEVNLLADSGVTHVGLPIGPGVREEDLSPEEARDVFINLPGGLSGVVITYLAGGGEIYELCSYMHAEWVQLHGDISLAETARLRRLNPELHIMKSLVVGKYDPAELKAQAEAFALYCDLFITDTFDPLTGGCGATGKNHDWEISRSLIRSLNRPVVLAGGLNAENVGAAIQKVRPAGVDAHTGLEDTRGRKDRKKVRDFVLNACRAWGNTGW